DHDPHITQLLSLFLHLQPFQTYQPIHPLHPLQKINQLKLHIVILHIIIPNVDGFHLSFQLTNYYHIPIFILTPKPQTSQKLKPFHLPTHHYLLKPFDPIQLLLTVNP
ncbi:response regulator, partial [Bacillus thuringiensis]|uniref:response regulator n=1 Tax=Bacillus thuringiensis TaxID=1428 RepID=UPI00119EEF8C